MPDRPFRTNPDVVATPLEDGDTVLLDLTKRRYYTLNETGTLIWQMVEDGAALSDIVTAITAEWDVSTEDARSSVQDLLGDLEKQGLVEQVRANGQE